jgi:spermidine synthase/S-adenosylmethionine/arginine decarboxylase-like enzyme
MTWLSFKTEILRDYGFVEPYPQRWHFADGTLQYDLIEDEKGEVELVWHPEHYPDETMTDGVLKQFQKELRLLYKTRNMIWNLQWNEGDHGVPENEWDIIWAYHLAASDAMAYAINALAEEEDDKVAILGKADGGVCSVDSCGDHYDILDEEPDDLDYVEPTCDNDELLRFPDYKTLENVKTFYQLMNFQERSDPPDVCMDLEDTLQICSSYRPHYHEFSAHFPARYIEEVRRVVFVGGGDSMLLHEVLKYPTLELVVGLELDQVVTRKSFKYFHTQPHFDDDRVQWWFGDAIKSLLLLPKEYWGSFDLLLVDLSETVMAFSVTEDLDVFDALALLLKPEGIMVKNELYMEEMSQAFDYTVQIAYESPKICSQAYALGSNKVDFFHHQRKDHGVETLLLMPLEQINDRFEWMHDYRKNDARADGKCDLETSTKSEVQERSAGILHVLDAENVKVFLDGSIEDLIYTTVENEGLTPVSTSSKDKDLVVVVLKEGYVVARMWPEHSYCALDINLWGSFQKAAKVRESLLISLGSESVSAFRVVVGGMFGSTTWKEDEELMGPQIVQRRDCEEAAVSDDSDLDEIASRVIIDEAVNMVHSIDLVAAVLCGVEDTDECVSVDVLEKHGPVALVIPLWTCPALDDDSKSVTKKYECEKKIMDQLSQALEPGNLKLDMFIIDSTAPFVMGQIMNDIWSLPRNRLAWLDQEHHIFLSMSSKPTEETWQRHLLDRYRKDVKNDPVNRAEFMLRSGDSSMELGVVSVGDEFIFHNLHTVEMKLRARLAEDFEIEVELERITGGLFPFKENFNPKEYVHDDYDNEPARAQFAQQQPLGRESVFQFELGEREDAVFPSFDEIGTCLNKTLTKLKFKISRFESFTDVGDGAVLVSVFSQGSAVLVWDGRQHFDVNLFSANDRHELADSFASSFVHFSSKNLKVALRDDFPRGLGRVVNFRSDIGKSKLSAVTWAEASSKFSAKGQSG